MEGTIKIKDRIIGSEFPAYIIAEMSANHHQSYDRAVQIIKAAASAGADAIKVQTYTPETLTIDSDQEYFKIKGTLWDGRNLFDLYREAFMPWEWQPKLQKIALDLGLDFFSTAYDVSAVHFLEELEVPVYKIASFELVDLPLLRVVAQTGKPIIISTGMATLAEIEEAVQVIREAGGNQIALLKCTSAYPAPPGEMNLHTIPYLADTLGFVTGLSDHTLGIEVPIASVALGGCIVEKHFTLTREDFGPDSAFSLEPEEFRSMVKGIRLVEQALGDVSFLATNQEQASVIFRRSLFIVEDIAMGEPFTERNIASIRPGHGLHTRYYDEILDCAAAVDIKKGTPLNWELIDQQR